MNTQIFNFLTIKYRVQLEQYFRVLIYFPHIGFCLIVSGLDVIINGQIN